MGIPKEIKSSDTQQNLFAYEYIQLLALTISPDFPLKEMITVTSLWIECLQRVITFQLQIQISHAPFLINTAKKTFPCQICSVPYGCLLRY